MKQSNIQDEIEKLPMAPPMGILALNANRDKKKRKSLDKNYKGFNYKVNGG